MVKATERSTICGKVRTDAGPNDAVCLDGLKRNHALWSVTS